MTSADLRWQPLAIAAAAALTAALAAALAWAMLSLPSQEGTGLAGAVRARLGESGVRHPVTAVLLNFRAWDTLLEIAVLLAAWLGTRAFGAEPRAAATAPPPLLVALQQGLLPVAIVVAVYLLWRGEHAPGGAFQAGAMLAAAGVLVSLAGGRLPARRWLPGAAAAGLAVFLAVALGTLAARGTLLGYPPAAAGGLILAIETAAMVSIAAILAALFDPELFG